MKNEFLVAMTQLAADKNLPKEVVFEAVEAALASAYKKDNLANSNVVVRIDRETAAFRVFIQRTVVEELSDERTEISVEEARSHRPDAEVGEIIEFETEAQQGGRIAAQTAKQVVLQRLREAEREVVFEEYSGKESDIVSGVVQRLEGRNVVIDLGRTEAILPPAEQVRPEHYRPGQRLKFYLLEVYKATRGPQVVVSRTHRHLLRRLFELEVHRPGARLPQQGGGHRPSGRCGPCRSVRGAAGHPHPEHRQRAQWRAHRCRTVGFGARPLRGQCPQPSSGAERRHQA
jgi:N utilization substance protein A